ncbi:adenine phosphoribosyltransferase [Caldicellulosiruptor bescii]|jgi:adenine phosphoribosyltransferase|uniref:Adenine phosphoribosyltransferase n=3 Tax=Caldicellulosiruptor TaxID=44000 RepID=APT_CALBD|nr:MULTISPECIES: adenine phosphoribosyltransferase [Caldicellulosiruptor]B9ML31.1 RecName: Full=Adenine phosphoribosyltransferase; Short=APRT [Caldicellulosiruptor bescii DSM 6725]ACM61039.1 adenine phosphoribosyltransferase [Caldicellulosiruptor bescii DSM 6725]ADQ45631.1 adenine phosphoribosyltransferase [Caldicellulosiruptor kronotskyensis 2002]PBC89147.1 adenine phosphoribosyltransferase [Caldicellulosiruptor bescii]PBC91371.1 adenine phosphoribosyltransferase [Caldicellulosiruptor bescii]
MNLKEKFRHVLNFPKEGIDFIDITTVLQDKDAFKYAIDSLVNLVKDLDFELIVGPESRGFIFGAPVAYVLNKGLVLVRKKGKLPYKTVSVEYELEYGKDVLEMHIDAIKPGQKVVIIDDLLATGGTTLSNIKLVEKLGGEVVGIAYLVELTYLGGRENLKGYDVRSVVQFESSLI